MTGCEWSNTWPLTRPEFALRVGLDPSAWRIIVLVSLLLDQFHLTEVDAWLFRSGHSLNETQPVFVHCLVTEDLDGSDSCDQYGRERKQRDEGIAEDHSPDRRP